MYTVVITKGCSEGTDAAHYWWQIGQSCVNEWWYFQYAYLTILTEKCKSRCCVCVCGREREAFTYYVRYAAYDIHRFVLKNPVGLQNEIWCNFLNFQRILTNNTSNDIYIFWRILVLLFCAFESTSHYHTKKTFLHSL